MTVRTVAAALAVVVATACNSGAGAGDEPKLCRADGTASLCLHHDEGDVVVTGWGFAPGSDVQVDLATGAGQLIPVADDGTFPAPGSQLGFLPGLHNENHRLEGTDRTGRPVAYDVTCSVDPAAKRPRCGF